MKHELQSLDAIRKYFLELVHSFETHPDYKRFATSPTHDGGPYIEKRGSTYAYINTERGIELRRRETKNPDDILYWLVSEVTREVAQKYELKHRQSDEDTRRLLFKKDIELLDEINPEWGQRKRSEYELILAEHPFRDKA